MGPLSILIVDDDRAWVKVLTRFLADPRHIVYSAGTCADGIDMAGRYRPDCILLDYHLSDGSAVDVCSGLRALRELHDTSVIILSSDPGAEMSAYGECRADKFLIKGAPLATILGAIESVCAAKVSRAKRADGGTEPPGPPLR